MIGMMNIGHEDSIEFYGSARPSSIFDRRKISKDIRSYMEDGRIMVNGVPVLPTESPDQLWSGLLNKMVAKNMVNQCVDKPGAIANLLRRLSSKISGSFSRKSEKNKDKEPDVVELADEDDAAHITRIQILTQAPRKENPQSFEDRTILNRLMREREALEKGTPKVSTETDRGHYDEDHRVVIEVDRF